MNRNNTGANSNIIQMLLDLLAIAAAYVLADTVGRIFLPEATPRFWEIAVAFAIVFFVRNKEARVYNVTMFYYTDRFFKIMFLSWLISFAVCALLLHMTDLDTDTKILFLTFSGVAFVFLAINMYLGQFAQQMFSDKKAPRIAYVGYYEDYQKFNYFLNKTNMKVSQVGYIVCNKDESHDGVIRELGKVEDLEWIIRKKHLDQIYFMIKTGQSVETYQEYINICVEMGVTAKVILDFQLENQPSSFVSSVGTYPVVTYHTISLNVVDKAVKRVFDIIGSLVGIILFAPIMLITALAIHLDSPGPVIFRQIRIGMNGRRFNIYKFRSMYIDAEERKAELMAQNEMNGLMFKMKNDPRVTKVGKVIRKLSIDELPQFFNVFAGKMSLVGTRPPTMDEVAQYDRAQWRRISIKPGITGMWQVSGRSNIQDFDKIVELDTEYIDNWSLWLDLKIIFKTVIVILRHKDSY